MVGLRYYSVCRLGKICNGFLGRLHRCAKCSASTGLSSSLVFVTCFSQQGQDVRMNNFFCVNTFLCCSSVSSPTPAIYASRAIRLLHVLRLSDCPTSFTLLFLTLPLLLMVHASTLSAIMYSAAASSNLMSASSCSSFHLINSLASDAHESSD